MVATLEELQEIVSLDDAVLRRERLAAVPRAELIDLWSDLSGEEATSAFSALGQGEKLALLEALAPGGQEILLTSLSGEHMRVLLEEMEPDDVADLVQSVSADVRKAVWRNLGQEAREKTEFLLRFDEDAAAGIMTPRYLAISRSLTVARAIAWVRRHAAQTEALYDLYVLDSLKRLVGVVSLKGLLSAEDEQKVPDIMTPRVVSVRDDTDQEEAARTLRTYNLAALPVVDRFNRLLGVITFDDVMDVMQEEATEDVYRMAAVGGEAASYMESTVWDLVRRRVPWLGLLLLAATVTTNVLSMFESLFVAATVLTLFIPTIIGTGGNSSTQASTQVIRGLATGDIRPHDLGRVVAKEVAVGVLLGATLGGLIFARSLLLPPAVEWHEAATVAIALAFVVAFATIVGAFSPLIIRRMGIDPTVVAAPVMATIIDLAGLTIYFAVARLLLRL